MPKPRSIIVIPTDIELIEMVRQKHQDWIKSTGLALKVTNRAIANIADIQEGNLSHVLAGKRALPPAARIRLWVFLDAEWAEPAFLHVFWDHIGSVNDIPGPQMERKKKTERKKKDD